MQKNKHIALHVCLCLLILSLIIWSSVYSFDGKAPHTSSDSNDYMRMGYHAYHHHTFSGDKTEPPKPSAFREPGYAAYQAGIIALNSNLNHIPLAAFRNNGRHMLAMRYGQIPILVISAFLGMILVYNLTQKISYAYLALLLIGFSYAMNNAMRRLFAEHFMVMLLILLSLLLFRAINLKKLWHFIAIGTVLGFIVLTKAIFMYFIVIVWGLFIFLFIMKQLNKRQLIIALLAISLPYTVIVGSWMTRNYIHFDVAYITGRAGSVMAIRNEYDKMNATEYFGAFYYWTPDRFVMRKMFEKHGNSALASDGALGMLNRDNRKGYYKTAKSIGEGSAKNAQRQKNKYLMNFIKHPFKHLAVTLPIGWRGIFHSNGFVINAPFYLYFQCTLLVSLTYAVSFVLLILLALRKKRWDIVAITLPVLYLYAINSLLTHNIPRYNLPSLGLCMVSFAVVLCYFRNKQSFAVLEIPAPDDSEPKNVNQKKPHQQQVRRK